MEMRDLVLMNKKLFHDHQSEFLATFKVALGSYWELMFGFDVIAFDDFVKPCENESTKDAIRRQYGDRAVSLIERLIGMTKETYDRQAARELLADTLLCLAAEVRSVLADARRQELTYAQNDVVSVDDIDSIEFALIGFAEKASSFSRQVSKEQS